jgi:tetratricopeptide (TPR) repeat protein
VIRSKHLSAAVVAAVLLVVCAPVWSSAKAKPTPGPSASPSGSPSPAASPTATPEPLDVAVPRLEAKLKTDPNDKPTMTQLAQDYYSINRPDLALGLTQKLLASGSKTAQVYYVDGISNAALGHEKEAIADLEGASNLEPTNAAVLGTLTTLYLRANRPADAERIAKRAITFNKSDENSLVTYGQVLATEQKYDDARTQFEAAAKLAPTDPHPVVLEAQTYASQNAIALAAQVYDRAVAIDPKSAEALAGKAQIAGVQHNVPVAIDTFNKLLALATTDDERAAVVDQMARLYAVEKMNAQADSSYRSAIATYPKVPATHLNYGDYLAFTKDNPGAVREWTAAAGPNRDNPDALSRLGDYYKQTRDLPKAVDNYKRLTEVAGSDPRTWLMLAGAYAQNHQYDKARDAFRHSYALGRSAEALVGLAQSDFATKNYKETILIFAALDKSAPNFTKQNPQVLYVLGQSYQKTGDKKSAREAYTRFLAYTKPGSQANAEVKQLITQMDQTKADAKPAAKPKATATKAPAKP